MMRYDGLKEMGMLPLSRCCVRILGRMCMQVTMMRYDGLKEMGMLASSRCCVRVLERMCKQDSKVLQASRPAGVKRKCETASYC